MVCKSNIALERPLRKRHYVPLTSSSNVHTTQNHGSISRNAKGYQEEMADRAAQCVVSCGFADHWHKLIDVLTMPRCLRRPLCDQSIALFFAQIQPDDGFTARGHFWHWTKRMSVYHFKRQWDFAVDTTRLFQRLDHTRPCVAPHEAMAPGY